MKKKMFMICVLAQSSYLMSQIETATRGLVPTPTSAEAYSLSKIGKLPLDLYRGKANITVPIYTITVQGVEIPIQLSYNTGGIKLNEVASSTGLGWSLSIPGTVQQNLLDKNDLYSNLFTRDINLLHNHTGYIDYTSYYNGIRNNIELLNSNYYDTKPDIFEYNLPTASGGFILKQNKEGFNVPYNNDKIKVVEGKIHIVDGKGTEYWLSGKNNVNLTGSGLQIKNTSRLYALDSMIINKSKAEFIYGKSNQYNERNITETVNIEHPKNYTGVYLGQQNLPKYNRTENVSVFMDGLITQINFDNGKVIFTYSDELPFSDGSRFRKDLNSAKGLALRKVTVINNAGAVIREITLNYNYFESSATSKTYEDYRLKLVNIHNNLDNSDYKFIYNEAHNLPKRNSGSDDYWGYINGISNDESTNIPTSTRYEIMQPFPTGVITRNREPNFEYAVLGSLKTIEYPTKGKKNLYYELPAISVRKDMGEQTLTKGILWYTSDSENPPFIGDNKVFAVAVNNEHFLQIAADGGYERSINVSFDPGSCYQPGGDQDAFPDPNDPNSPDRINTCWGGFSFTNGQSYGSMRLFNRELGSSTVSGTVSIKRRGECSCHIGVGIKYKKRIYSDQLETYSGLRIRKIEDVDAGNMSNVYEYAYGKWTDGNFKAIAQIRQPLIYTKKIKFPLRNMVDGVETPTDPSQRIFQEFTVLSSSSLAGSSYNSSELFTYPYVIEKTGKGEVRYEFSDIGMMTSYNKWKYGHLLNETLLNSNNEILKTTNNTYANSLIKNELTDYITSNPEVVAFSADFDIVKSKKQVPLLGDVDVYDVDVKIEEIESGKLELSETVVKEFFAGKQTETKTVNSYYDTDINRPVNLKNTVSTFASGESVTTEYQYAYEKGNQWMKDKNITDTPLETTVYKKVNGTTKAVSGIRTVYPVSQAEADTKTSGLALPVTVLSSDIVNNIFSVDVSYDRYDSKGNLLQYTTKDGIPVTIVWGYGQTLPIAKVEGVKLQNISQNLIDSITGLSNSNNSEAALISALDNFRNHSSLSGYQITTYTYDPLVGIKSITQPSGIREMYIYDSAKRLKKVTDMQGKVLKEYQYHYKE